MAFGYLDTSKLAERELRRRIAPASKARLSISSIM